MPTGVFWVDKCECGVSLAWSLKDGLWQPGYFMACMSPFFNHVLEIAHVEVPLLVSVTVRNEWK